MFVVIGTWWTEHLWGPPSPSLGQIPLLDRVWVLVVLSFHFWVVPRINNFIDIIAQSWFRIFVLITTDWRPHHRTRGRGDSLSSKPLVRHSTCWRKVQVLPLQSAPSRLIAFYAIVISFNAVSRLGVSLNACIDSWGQEALFRYTDSNERAYRQSSVVQYRSLRVLICTSLASLKWSRQRSLRNADSGREHVQWSLRSKTACRSSFEGREDRATHLNGPCWPYFVMETNFFLESHYQINRKYICKVKLPGKAVVKRPHWDMFGETFQADRDVVSLRTLIDIHR